MGYVMRLYVGAGNDPDGFTLHRTEQLVAERLSETFGGCTVWQSHGCWEGPLTIYRETSVVGEVLIAEDTPEHVAQWKDMGRAIARNLAEALRQESVLFVFYPIETVEFVAAETVFVAQKVA